MDVVGPRLVISGVNRILSEAACDFVNYPSAVAEPRATAGSRCWELLIGANTESFASGRAGPRVFVSRRSG